MSDKTQGWTLIILKTKIKKCANAIVINIHSCDFVVKSVDR